MSNPASHSPRRIAFRAAAVLALLLAAACADRRPDRESSSEAPGVDIDVRPSLVNRDEVRAAARALYPPELQQARVGGIVSLGIRVEIDGRPGEMTIYETSGEPALDSAAMAVGRRMHFEPGQLDGEPVPVWVMIPVTFQP
jgi:protein TonB